MFKQMWRDFLTQYNIYVIITWLFLLIHERAFDLAGLTMPSSPCRASQLDRTLQYTEVPV